VTLHDDSRARVPIVATGASVLTPLADDVGALVAALRDGKSSLAPAADLGGADASRFSAFDATRYANVRGMRVYNRATQMGICAARLALNDAGLGVEGGAPLDGLQLGIVTASTFGHIDTLLEYDRNLITLGVQRTNPTLMPLGLPSAPGAAIALAFGAKAFSVTLSDGGASGLGAIGLGARLLAHGRARYCVVVSAFTLAAELIASAKAAGMLAPAGELHVLDRRAQGTAFGEAAAAIVLERADDARARDKAPKGFVRAHAATFAASSARRADALARACRNALAGSRVEPAQVALASTSANGVPAVDRAEAHALLAALGDSAARTPLTALKGNVGDSMDTSGVLQALCAFEALRSGVAMPIARFEEPAVAGLRYLAQPAELAPGCALLTSTSDSGACSALVLATRHD
jgi:3-oxoacyl-[acyl-carrier-protein] synthase II